MTRSSSAPATVTALPGARSTAPPSARSSTTPAKLKTPPAWLSVEAKAIWRSLVPDLEATYPEVIATIDVPALAIMVEHLAIAQAAAQTMRGKGNKVAVTEVDEAHRDRLRKHPASQIMRDHGKAFMELAREYGITPKARKLLDLSDPVEVDDDEDDDLFAD